MKSELAKTLRAMSDDHRMVPDFSEQLLDIADAIERQAKELAHKKSAWLFTALNDYAYEKWADGAKERDAALAEVERLKRENNDFREERDLAMSELEPLVEQNQKLQAKLSVIPIATGAPRCTLCGVILDGALHKQFCSTCCAR